MYKHFDNLVLALVGTVAVSIGLWGFADCERLQVAACQTSTKLEWLFRTVALVRGGGTFNFSEHPWQLVIAEFAIPFVAITAGVKLFLAGIRRDMRVLMARRKHDHTIVCGLGETGMQIVNHLLEADHTLSRRLLHDAKLVVIDTNADNPFTAACERQSVPVLLGDASQPGVLAMAGLARARTVIVCTGDDARNLDVALRVKDLVAGKQRLLKRRLRLVMELRSEWFLAKLVERNRRSLSSETVDLRAFNTYANAARLILQSLKPPPHPRLDGGSFVIVGFGSMGREIALALLRSCPAPLGRRPEIIVFDRAADAVRENFLSAYPGAAALGELRFRTIDFVPGGAAFTTLVAVELCARPVQAVFVCLPNDAMSLNVGLDLRRQLDQVGHVRPPVKIRLRRHHRLSGFLEELEAVERPDHRLSTFGALEDLLDPAILFSEKLDRLAIACHQQYVDELSPEQRHLPANRPWHDLAESLKTSNRWKADHIGLMLTSVGLTLNETSTPARIALTDAEIETLAQFEHRRWAAALTLQGWTHGPVRDAFQRKHEHLIGWEELRDDIRARNRREIAALPSILACIGLEVRRPERLELFTAPTDALPSFAATADATPGAAGRIVFADTDRSESRALAERLIASPSARLWLVGREPPERLLAHHPEVMAQIGPLIERAEGWALIAEAMPAPERQP